MEGKWSRFVQALALSFLLAFVRTPSVSFGQANEVDVGNYYRQGNVTYDLTAVHDAEEKTQILAALELGYQVAPSHPQGIGIETQALRGDGSPRTIRFFSDAREESPDGRPSAQVAQTTWKTARGWSDFTEPANTREDIRVFLAPNQPYWYLVNDVWHELLHVTLNITHSQTTMEGSMPQAFVNNGVWYSRIKAIMFSFPRTAIDPVTHQSVELYNPENSPWSDM